MQVVDDEMEPETVIAVLREKIADTKRRITGFRVDIQVVESIEDHNPQELEILNRNLVAARKARDAYQARLDAIAGVAREQLT